MFFARWGRCASMVCNLHKSYCLSYIICIDHQYFVLCCRYTELPKSFRPRLVASYSSSDAAVGQPQSKIGQGIIRNYFASNHCAVCSVMTSNNSICDFCRTDPQSTVHNLTQKVYKWDKCVNEVRQICQNCIGFSEVDGSESCVSLDCPVIYKKKMAAFDADQIDYVQELLNEILF